MNAEKPAAYLCDDSQLMDQLAQLFTEGAPEVEVQHPTEGSRIVTREQFEGIKAAIAAADGSPAERVIKSAKRVRRIKAMQKRLVRDMNECDVREINQNDEIGTDVNGDTFDVEGLTFIDPSQYPVGVTPKEAEVGALIDPGLLQKPVRLVCHI